MSSVGACSHVQCVGVYRHVQCGGVCCTEQQKWSTRSVGTSRSYSICRSHLVQFTSNNTDHNTYESALQTDNSEGQIKQRTIVLSTGKAHRNTK